MSVISKSNYSLTPLGAGAVLLGRWDNVLPYASAIITVSTDRDGTLSLYTGMTTTSPLITNYPIIGNTPFVLELPLNYPYLKANLINTSANGQTFLNFEIIYREAVIQTPQVVGITGAVGITGGVSQIGPWIVGVTGSVNSWIADSTGLPINLGNYQMSHSLPVTIALDQTLIGITGAVGVLGNVWIADSTGLPIDLGQKEMLHSLPVTIASDQTDLNVIINNSATIGVNDMVLEQCVSYGSTASTATLSIDGGNTNAVLIGGTVSITGAVDVNNLVFNGDGYLETIDIDANTKLQTLIDQTLLNGGIFWSGATVADGADSAIVNLSEKSAIIYSFFGNVFPTNLDSSIVLTPYFSGDGTNFYKSDINISPLDIIAFGNTNSDFCYSTPCGAGYVRLKITGLTGDCVVTAILNHI